jgi:uncharacterized coiled-coil protein SlyX
MRTLEERVAYLEGQVSEHSHTLIEIRDSIRQLERRVDARFDRVNTSFDRVNTSFDQVNARFEQFEGRFGQLEGRSDSRFDQLERRFETRFDAFDRRLEGLDEKVARHFTWLVGIQVTALIAIVGALLARP